MIFARNNHFVEYFDDIFMIKNEENIDLLLCAHCVQPFGKCT